MNNFELDKRLAENCFVLGKLKISRLLLMNNSLVPWFILVPEGAETELTDLSPADQAGLLEEINMVSGFVKGNFGISKLNTAAIGNIVSQLHIHVVGRAPSDYCWPDVVWGKVERKPYAAERVNEITAAIGEHLGDKFSREMPGSR